MRRRAKSTGGRPCQVLPETFPTDIDIAWYLREATDMLTDLGVKVQSIAGPQAALFEKTAA